MKNIHVLPTDKLSDLLLCIKDYTEHKNTPAENSDKIGNFRLGFGKYTNTEFYKFQHIYITSDDKIKQKDRFFNTKSGAIGKHNGADILLFKEDKKIILTTDQDLIKDGVQAIPDDFLEWFVKNPSCEFVEIEDVYFHGNGYYKASELSESQKIQFAFMKSYKIITPKEEPKLTNVCIKCGVDLYCVDNFVCQEHPKNCKGIYLSEETLKERALKEEPKREKDYTALLQPVGTKEEPKQETLEEVCNKINFINSRERVAYYNGLKYGAKWQQEQNKKMYSEEEVLQALIDCFDAQEYNHNLTVQEWFEQFKNK